MNESAEFQKSVFIRPQIKQLNKIAKAQLAEKALFYYGDIQSLTQFKLPKLGSQKEYYQYLEGDEQQINNLPSRKKLEFLNQSEIRKSSESCEGETNQQSSPFLMSSIQDSIHKQSDQNILRPKQKSRLRLTSIMIDSESEYKNRKSIDSQQFYQNGKDNRLNSKHHQLSSKRYQNQSPSTQYQTPTRRFISPITSSGRLNHRVSSLNKSSCEYASLSFNTPIIQNKSFASPISNEVSPAPIRSAGNLSILSRLLKRDFSKNKKVFNEAYDFVIPNANNSNKQNTKVRSLSLADDLFNNDTTKIYNGNNNNKSNYRNNKMNSDQSKLFITEEPESTIDQQFAIRSLQQLDHISPPRIQKNPSITSFSFSNAPPTINTLQNNTKKNNTRYTSVQPLLSSPFSHQKKKRSESVDKYLDSTTLIKSNISGLSSSNSNITNISRLSEANVIRSLKKMLQNRINIKQLQIHQDVECKRLLNHFTNKWYDLISSIQRKDLDNTLFLVIQLLNTLVSFNDMDCFLHMLLFLSKVYIDFQDFDKAIFFLSQGKIICDYSQNFSKKIEFLKQLSICANGLRDYKSSALFLKKALEYSWIIKDKHQELFIYDRLGLNYYYLGDLITSKFYHERFMSGECEPLDSPKRQMAEQDIRDFLYDLDCKTEGFSRILFGKLSLPIINIYDNDRSEQEEFTKTKQTFNFIQNSHQNTCDKYKIYNYKTCIGRSLLEQMINEKEFKFEINTPIQPYLTYDETFQANKDTDDTAHNIKKRMALPRVLIKELEKRKKEKQKNESKNRNLNDASKYKISYETRVKQMLNDKETYEQIMNRVKTIVQYQCFDTKSTPVLLNHLDEDRQKILQEKLHDQYELKKKYESLLSDIIADFILRKKGQSISDTYFI